MWKYACPTICILFCQLYTHAQSLHDNLLAGNWYVTRWETQDRLLDFEDTTASMRFMIERFKNKNNVHAVLAADSLRILQELRKILPAAQVLRFRLLLNKDKTFVWSKSSNDTGLQYKGTYSLSSDMQQLTLVSLDGPSNTYQTTPIKLHALHPNELIIEIPSGDPGFKQSKFTLKRQ